MVCVGRTSNPNSIMEKTVEQSKLGRYLDIEYIDVICGLCTIVYEISIPDICCLKERCVEMEMMK